MSNQEMASKETMELREKQEKEDIERRKKIEEERQKEVPPRDILQQHSSRNKNLKSHETLLLGAETDCKDDPQG